TSAKGLAYVCVLVRVISQRLCWLAVVVGRDDADVVDPVEEAVWALDWLAVVVDVGDEEVPDDPRVEVCWVVDRLVVVVGEEAKDEAVVVWVVRLLVVVEVTAVPKTLSSAALV